MSTANVIIFFLKNNGIDTDQDDGNDVNCIPLRIQLIRKGINCESEKQLLSDAELDLQGRGGTKLITDESQALASGQVKFRIFSCFLNTRLTATGNFQPKNVFLLEQYGGPPATKKVAYCIYVHISTMNL